MQGNMGIFSGKVKLIRILDIVSMGVCMQRRRRWNDVGGGAYKWSGVSMALSDWREVEA